MGGLEKARRGFQVNWPGTKFIFISRKNSQRYKVSHHSYLTFLYKFVFWRSRLCMGLQYENSLTCLYVWCVEIHVVDHCYEEEGKRKWQWQVTALIDSTALSLSKKITYLSYKIQSLCSSSVKCVDQWEGYQRKQKLKIRTVSVPSNFQDWFVT